MRTRTIHMVGNAHIDPVWLWTDAEGRQEVVDTCRSALDRMDETSQFVFCRSSAATYEWLQEHAPSLFREVRKRAREGRWIPVGGWWEQPDCNLPSGEALVRQGLVGKTYFMERLGIEVETGYNVDTFGHAWSLPQILKGMGLKYYVFFRPGPHEKHLPSGPFWWAAPDGTRTLTVRPPGHYNTGPGEIEARVAEAAASIVPGLSDGIAFYGVGNHGGGPTKENIASILMLNQRPDLPHLRFSHPKAYFRGVSACRRAFPVVRDELQYHSRGCYTSVSAIKRANRRAEDSLLNAETWLSVAGVVLGRRSGKSVLDTCWKTVLFNQFHDILAGTSIRAACDEAVRQNDLVIGKANDTAMKAARALAARVDLRGPGQGLIVFNPLSWQRGDLVEGEINWREPAGGVVLETPDGAAVECQVLKSMWSGGGRSVRILASAIIGACGYTGLRARPAQVETTRAPRTTRAMDNGLLRVSFGLGGGHQWLGSLTDLEARAEVGKRGLAGLVVLEDPSDTWSHGVDRFRDEIGRFEVVGEPQVKEWGPLRWTVRLAGRWGRSRAWQEFSLCRGRRQLDVTLEVDWHERHRMLKLTVPTRVEEGEATYEIPYGAIVRPATGDEEPAQRWVDVSGRLTDQSGRAIPYGVSLLNDCKYGFDIRDAEIRISILRSPIYAFHDPARVQRGETYEYTDQGRQVLRYSILPHRGTWRDAETIRRAAELNRPCLVLHEPAHEGALPPSYTFVATDRANVDVEAVKPAERSDEIVIRLRETSGKRTRCRVILPGPQRVPLSLRGWEIKTLAIAGGVGQWTVRKTDLLERDLRRE